MSKVDITIEVCGMAGGGTIAAGGLINEALSAAGFSIMGFDSYPAEIRGFGRCVTRSRAGNENIAALSDQSRVLISLDDEQSISRIPFLEENASVFFESRPASYTEESKSLIARLEPTVSLFPVPFSDLATAASGNARGRNLTAIGAFAAVFGIDPEFFREVISKKFGNKGEKVLQANLKSFDAGYDFALNEFSDRSSTVLASPDRIVSDRIMMSGNEAIGKAALDADLKLYFGYPITPATPIMEYLAKHLPKKGGRVIQMEDEISSIGAVLGSFYAGSRAMTATSGPGFALMTEMITHGIMAEIPAVILDAQRGGPSTGLPTKTEQSDLHAAVFGGPGDSPRIVIAPTSVSECYFFTAKSFQLAEKYQCPVIILTDFFLDNRVENIQVPHINDDEKRNCNMFPDSEKEGRYKRYELTESGISPRALPGTEGFTYVATGLEHTEYAAPDYSPEIHMSMSEKRHKKLQNALEDLPAPELFFSNGDQDVGVIGWGSTFGSVLEAVSEAREKGLKVAAMKISSIYPYHRMIIKDFMAKCRKVLIAELNYEGQLADLIGHLYHADVQRLNEATGTPMSPVTILKRIEVLCDSSIK